MSDKHLARRAETQVVLNGVDISVYVNKDWLSFTYTDNEEDEADDLQIKVCDRDGKWLRKWLNSIIDGGALGGSVISAAPEGSTKTSTSSGSSSSASGGNDKPRYRVTASTGVNIRKGAGEKYKVIGKLPYGTIVEVYGFYSSWAKITYSGKNGYIKGTNLKSVGGGGSSSSSSSSSSTKSSSSKKSGSTANTQIQTGKGLKISAVIVLRNGNNDGKDAVLDCGQFELDSIDAQGPPATVTIKATSLAFSNTVRQTLKSKSWENITLSEIAGQIARQNGMGVLFESEFNPRYSRVEQYQTSDIAFLQKLCHNAGCSLKATNNILVVFDQAAYEGKKAVRKIRFGEEAATPSTSCPLARTTVTPHAGCTAPLRAARSFLRPSMLRTTTRAATISNAYRCVSAYQARQRRRNSHTSCSVCTINLRSPERLRSPEIPGLPQEARWNFVISGLAMVSTSSSPQNTAYLLAAILRRSP